MQVQRSISPPRSATRSARKRRTSESDGQVLGIALLFARLMIRAARRASDALLFEVPEQSSPLAVQEPQMGGTSVVATAFPPLSPSYESHGQI